MRIAFDSSAYGKRWSVPNFFSLSPLEIGMAIFDVALTFALAVAEFGTSDTAAIGRRVPNRGKATDCTRFEHDRLGQNLTDAIDT